MKIAVLCEFSGIVRDAFLARGHDAISCDLEPTEKPGPHIRGDCRDYDWSGYDLIIAHPPCTYLSVIANKAMIEHPERLFDRINAYIFFMWIYNLSVKKICVENPVGYMNTHFRKPNQIIHPWFFGDREMKRTCLWLRGLPLLQHNSEDDLFFKKTHTEKPQPSGYRKSGKTKGNAMYFCDKTSNKTHKQAAIIRSRTFPGIAKAMAEQWG